MNYRPMGMGEKKKLILMNKHNYVGREYIKAFSKTNLSFDVARIGNYPLKDKLEDLRCGGKWIPPNEESFEYKIHDFKSLNSKEFDLFLKQGEYYLGIQAGTGIINEKIISRFSYGILNFHPGDLPKYRGASAPEWQLYENKNVICTCHLIDKGIDSGPILWKKRLYPSEKDYYSFRASIYSQISKFLYETIKKIDDGNFKKNNLICQDESQANTRKYIGEERISILKKMFKS